MLPNKFNYNLNLYKDFYFVCKYGSLSKAAEAAYTSAPAISKSIKKLEEELGRDLFYRKSTGMELTKYGKDLLYYVEKIFSNLSTAERSMLEDDNLQRGSLSIGMPSNVGTFLLFDKILEFHNNYPNIEISVVTGGTKKLMNLLNNHDVDFVIDMSPVDVKLDEDIIIKEIMKVNYRFVVHKDSSINIKSINELVDKQLVLPIKGTANRKDLDKVFEMYNLSNLNILSLHTSEMILAAVKKNLGIGYVIEDMIKLESDLKVLDLCEKLPSVKINLIYNPKYLTTTPRRFIEMYIDKSINK